MRRLAGSAAVCAIICAVICAVIACGRPSRQDSLLAIREDSRAVRAHAWQLWTHLAGDATPAWDGWAATEQLFGGAPPNARPRFRTPRPFRHGDAIDTETLPVMFDVQLDPHAAEHIRAHGLASRATLAHLRELPAFPPEALAVKLVWYAVHAKGLTAMPIWDGDPAQPDGDGNPDRTWQRAVAVDPARATIADGETADVTLEGRHLVARVVPLANFIHRELVTDEEVATARTAAHDPTLARGDHVAVVAVHLTTKEIPDWTWETYWWHDRPDDGPFAAGRPALVGPAAHYLMDATFDTRTPCFNPWLEARFPDGLRSNCVTCHQRAVVGAADYLPVTQGRLPDHDPYFTNHPQTDFMWSLAFEPR
jgi:hypothetical protein